MCCLRCLFFLVWHQVCCLFFFVLTMLSCTLALYYMCLVMQVPYTVWKSWWCTSVQLNIVGIYSGLYRKKWDFLMFFLNHFTYFSLKPQLNLLSLFLFNSWFLWNVWKRNWLKRCRIKISQPRRLRRRMSLLIFVCSF